MAWPRRRNAPGVGFDDLPPIDAVLLTHNHYDHLDLTTLLRLAARDNPKVIAPLGNDRVIERAAPSIGVETLDWGGSTTFDATVVAHLVPANHWSARGVGDRRMTFWSGYYISTPGGTI